MKNMIVLWLMTGALAASVGLNVRYAIGTGEAEKPCVACKVILSAPAQPRCMLVETVGLTAAQKEQFAGCCRPVAQRRGQLHQKISTLVADLDRELCAKAPNAKLVSAIADDLGKARAEEFKNRIDGILLVRQTLTPDQLQRLVTSCGQKCAKPNE